MKCLTGWIPSWNQDCWEKYQQHQTCRWHHPYGRKQRGTKEPLDEGKRGEWKTGLKLSIQKTGIQSWHTVPITSWQIDGGKMETLTDFIFLDSKITADGDWRHEIKRHLHLGRQATTNLDSILKSRDITLLTQVHIVKAMVFPVVMYRCESWTLKKAECWRRLLRVLWQKGDQTSQSKRKSILNIHWKDWYWSWSSDNLATWCKEPTNWKCWERLKAGREGEDREWDGWMVSLTQWMWVWANSVR